MANQQTRFAFRWHATLILAFLGLSGMLCAAKRDCGWHLVNTTSTPLSVAWYETKIEKRTNKQADSAEKIRCSESLIMEAGESQFLPALITRSEDTLYQLMITQSPALLKPTLSIDTGDTLEGIFAYDKTTLEILKKPLLRYLPSNPKIYIGQPEGTTRLILIPSTTPLTHETLFEEGWYLYNTTEQALYAGWYTTSWDSKKRSYTDPTLGTGQYLFPVAPGQKVPISYPKEGNKLQWHLLMSFDKSILTKTITRDAQKKLAHGLLEQTKAELGTFNTLWKIYEKDGTPIVLPHNHLIQVINTTNNPLYGALYYVDSAGAIKYGPHALVTEILPQLSAELQYPPRQWWRTIKLLIAREDQKELLYETSLTPEQLQGLYIKGFQRSNFANWYIEGAFAIEPNRFDPSKFHVSSIGGGLIERLARKAVDMSAFKGSRIKKYEAAFKAHDPRYLPDQDICSAQGCPSVLTDPSQKIMEDAFLAKRSEIVRSALNKLFGEELIQPGQPVPKVALVFTGGGYRAMIETIGFIEGAASSQDGNILDCCQYLAGLSGSTWAINSLVASGLSPHGFAKHQKYKVGEGGFITLKRLMSNMLEQSTTYPEQRFIESRYSQFHGPIGLYGHALAHHLLYGFKIEKRDAHTMRLSDLRMHLTDAKYPLPLSVAVDPGNHDKERVWYEFSPYYCGTYQEQGSWIDTKLLGCSFSDGRPIHIVPEYPLAHYMGIWGSAFALSEKDIEKGAALSGFLTRSFTRLGTGFAKAYALLFSEAADGSLAPGRATAGTLPNYNYKRTSALDGIASRPLLHFIDAGITMEGEDRHNFATIPVLWRDADVIIMCDCTESPNSDIKSEHLLASDEEARRQRLAFPSLTRSTRHTYTLKHMHQEVVSLFVEDRAPLVVYMKAKKNKLYNGYLAGKKGSFKNGFDPDASVAQFTYTTNFSYTPEEYDVLKGLTKSIFVQSKDAIKSALRKAIERTQKAPS